MCHLIFEIESRIIQTLACILYQHFKCFIMQTNFDKIIDCFSVCLPCLHVENRLKPPQCPCWKTAQTTGSTLSNELRHVKTKLKVEFSLSLTGSASRTDLSQLANGIWEIHAGCPSFLRVSSVAKIGYIPQFKASNARDQEVSSDLARM